MLKDVTSNLRPPSASFSLFLYSVAQSLSQVVRKMGNINEKLNEISSSNKEVEEVADLWRESFASSRSVSESSSLSLSHSRDLNYCVP